MCTKSLFTVGQADNLNGTGNTGFDVRTDLSGWICLFDWAAVVAQRQGGWWILMSGQEVESQTDVENWVLSGYNLVTTRQRCEAWLA